MKTKMTFILFFILFLWGCSGLAVKKQLVGRYYITAADDITQSELTLHDDLKTDIYLTVIPNYVFDIRYNNSYIIAKQHPITANRAVNYEVTNYYIVLLSNSGTGSVIGPISNKEYSDQKKRLNINLDFD